MAGDPTQTHHDWVSTVLGNKVGDIVQNKLGNGIPLKKDISIEIKKLSFLKGYVTLKGAFAGSIEGKCKIDSEDKTRLDAEKIIVEYGSKWVKEKATKEVEKDGLFADLKLEGMKVTGTQATAIGQLDLEITLLGIEKSKAGDSVRILPTFATAKLTLNGIGIALPDNTEVVGLKLTGINAKIGGSVELGPDVAEILKGWLLKQMEKRAFDAARSTGERVVEAALEGLAIDAIITGAFIMAGVATIAGALYEAAKGDEFKAVGDNIGQAWRATSAGWLAGACGDGAPSDRFGQISHPLGKQAYDKATQEIKAKRPDLLEPEIKAYISKEMRSTYRDGLPPAAYEALNPPIRRGYWKSYLASHTGFLTEKDAKMAFQICFTDSVKREGNKDWQEYLDQHKVGQHL